MQQSKLDSFIEACINVGIGFGVSVVANFIIFPIVGVSASTGDIIIIGIFMTFVSVARSYFVRRFSQRYLTSLKEKIVSFFRKEVK